MGGLSGYVLHGAVRGRELRIEFDRLLVFVKRGIVIFFLKVYNSILFKKMGQLLVVAFVI